MTAVTPPLTGFARVNLMPRPEIVRRERDKAVRLWVWIVLAAILVAILIIAGAFTFKLFADQRLAAEQARTNELLTEIAALSEVSQALGTERELTEFRAEAMASDFEWAAVIEKLTAVLPPDTALTGFDVITGGVPQGDDPAAEPGLVGTVSIDSATPLDIVAIIRSLRGVEGVLFADGRSVTTSEVSEGRFAYVLDMVFDQSIYSGQYSPTEGND